MRPTKRPTAVSCQDPIRAALQKRGPLTVSLEYVLKSSRRSTDCALSGKGRFFDVRDIITLEDMGPGSRVSPISPNLATGLALSIWLDNRRRGSRKWGAPVFRGWLGRWLTTTPPPHRAIRQNVTSTYRGTELLYAFRIPRGRSRWAPMSTDMTGKHVVLTGANSGLGPRPPCRY
ncbi:MAG: hypothetical protein CM15mP84_09360 [Cellvibrionales bacterium]|nr:MAG: hypothetical protein CM15mP84_09360 [Cellvibrionales bacterium]